MSHVPSKAKYIPKKSAHKLIKQWQIPEELKVRTPVGMIDYYCTTPDLSESSRRKRKDHLYVFFIWMIDARKSWACLEKADLMEYKSYLQTKPVMKRLPKETDEIKKLRHLSARQELELYEFYKYLKYEVENDPEKQTYINKKMISDAEERLREQRVERLKARRTSKPINIKTANLCIIALRGFFSWYEEMGYGKNLATSLKPFKNTSRRKTHVKGHLSVRQCAKLLEACKDNPLQYAICNFLLRTGMREVELERAMCSDVDYQNDINGNPVRVLWVQGKGRKEKEDYVILTDKAWFPVKNYILATRGHFNPDEPLFMSYSNRSKGKPLKALTIRTIVLDALRKAGLTNERGTITPHSLRHTFAVNYLKQCGGNIYMTQAALRHKSPLTTEIYVESVKDEVRLSNPVENRMDDLF